MNDPIIVSTTLNSDEVIAILKAILQDDPAFLQAELDAIKARVERCKHPEISNPYYYDVNSEYPFGEN